MNKISLRDTFREALALYKQRPWFILWITLIETFAANLVHFHASLMSERPSAVLFFITLFVCFFSVWLLIGKTKIFLSLIDRRPLPFKALFSGTELIWSMFIGELTYQLICMVGAILLVIPGVVWAAKYSLIPLLIVDREIRPDVAQRESARLTNGYKRSLALIGSIIIPVYLFGDIPFKITLSLFPSLLQKGALFIALDCIGFAIFGLGYVIAISITYLAFLIAYRQIEREQNQAATGVLLPSTG